MVCDAHVHVGYFPRKDGLGGDAFYYSPRRISGVLKRAGIGEFIFSSTNVVWDESAQSMHNEALEMKRLCGNAAHPFFWVRGEYLGGDPDLELLPDFYEGLKLHGGVTSWLTQPNLLTRVLAIAAERHWPVQIHTSADEENHVSRYLPFCRMFPAVRFDMAHVQDLSQLATIESEFENVYTDIAYLPVSLAKKVVAAAPHRVMFGSDIPAPLKYGTQTLGVYLRKILDGLAGSPKAVFAETFHRFLNVGNKQENGKGACWGGNNISDCSKPEHKLV